MFLLEPAETQFDLKFWLFRTHVRVHPMFWAVSALLGQDFLQPPNGGLGLFLSWIAGSFVSILLHEMGHVLAGRLFGAHGHIVLYSFGGLAIGSSQLNKRWQRIVVYLAGPAAQLILWVLLYLFFWYGLPHLLHGKLNETQKFFLKVLAQLLEINLYWPILNLLPIWPLDGGRVSREVLDSLMPRKGISISLGISFSLAALLAANSIYEEIQHKELIPYLPTGGWWMALFFGMFALQNYAELQQIHANKQWHDEHWDHDERM